MTFFAGIERAVKNETTRKAPWGAYITLCLCLFVSSGASNLSLNYINYPTKVVFRSCKVYHFGYKSIIIDFWQLVPTIIIAMAMNKKRVKLSELFFGLLISLGMVLFAVADFQVSPNANAFGACILIR